MAKPKQADTKGKVSKTARVSTEGRRTDQHKMCPTHPERRLVAALLIQDGSRRAKGWICGALGIGNVERDSETHYMLQDFRPWGE